jgi:hypothetical protein
MITYLVAAVLAGVVTLLVVIPLDWLLAVVAAPMVATLVALAAGGFLALFRRNG